MPVTSGHLKWEPKGGQVLAFAQDPPRPVHDDILLAKLRPGQVSPNHPYLVRGSSIRVMYSGGGHGTSL
jgi:DNA-directed RNA polymerases I and III subunit RPAC1